MIYLSDMIKQLDHSMLQSLFPKQQMELGPLNLNMKVLTRKEWHYLKLDGGTLDEALEYLEEYDINIKDDYDYVKSFNVDINKKTVDVVIMHIR